MNAKPTMSNAHEVTSSRANPRSSLQQQRSRQREVALLDAAEALVAEAGFDGLSMREIARRAGTPIASLYHYFPSVAAIVRRLSTRQLDLVSSFIEDRLTQHTGQLDVELFAGTFIDDVAAFVGELPAAAAIWNALRSHPELRALDRADTIAVARRFLPLLHTSRADISDEMLEAFSVVLLESVAVNLTFALELPADRRSVHIAALRAFVTAGLRAMRPTTSTR